MIKKYYIKIIKKQQKLYKLFSNNKKIYKRFTNKDESEESMMSIQYNPIKNLFSQLKSHIKNKSSDNFKELKNIIKYIITKDHLKNYYINKNVI